MVMLNISITVVRINRVFELSGLI